MKKLLLLVAIIGAGYYAYTHHFAKPEPVAVTSYQDVLKKVEATPVSQTEVVFGANQLARFLCEGNSQCLEKHTNYREMCENRIFADAPKTYSRKDDVISVSKSFTQCVGVR